MSRANMAVTLQDQSPAIFVALHIHDLSLFYLLCYLGIVALILWSDRARNVTLSGGGPNPITETQAIEFTRKALNQVGEKQ